MRVAYGQIPRAVDALQQYRSRANLVSEDGRRRVRVLAQVDGLLGELQRARAAGEGVLVADTADLGLLGEALLAAGAPMVAPLRCAVASCTRPVLADQKVVRVPPADYAHAEHMRGDLPSEVLGEGWLEGHTGWW